MRNKNNITWVKGERYCRWKGESCSPKNSIKLFGAAHPEPEIDRKDFLLVDKILYCSHPKTIVKIVRDIVKDAKPLISHNLIWGELGRSAPVIEATELHFLFDFKKILPYEEASELLALDKIREFVSDLDAYYDDLCKETRKQIS